jgi:hypothetical protein
MDSVLGRRVDPSPLLRAFFTIGFAAMQLFILHGYAVRHGGSMLKNLGARGWAIALAVVFAAGMFSNVVMLVLLIAFNVPSVDWTMAIFLGAIYGAVGTGISFLAWRALDGGLPQGPAPAPQKG